MVAQEAPWLRYSDVDDGNFVGRGRGVPLLVALVAVLVCFIVVCLYLRWTCHRYNRPRHSRSSSSASATPRSLDDATIAGFPVNMYRPGADGDAAQCCPICLDDFAEGDKVKALPRCGHEFHPECVDPWLRARASCALYRASLLAATKPEAVGSEAV